MDISPDKPIVFISEDKVVAVILEMDIFQNWSPNNAANESTNNMKSTPHEYIILLFLVPSLTFMLYQ